jgi:hypothetical protein
MPICMMFELMLGARDEAKLMLARLEILKAKGSECVEEILRSNRGK